MTDFAPAEKAVPIRLPATANLMIDSADRSLNPAGTQPNPFDFQITKNNSIMNGYFTRIGTTEVVLEWNEPNGAYLSGLGDTQLEYTSSSVVSTITVPNTYGAFLFYNQAEALQEFVDVANAVVSAPVAFSLSTISGQPAIVANADFLVSTSAVTVADGIPSVDTFAGGTPLPAWNIRNGDLRPYRYLDFTSQQLTYNQDLKDTATSAYARDVLCRWYMDWDQQPQRDALGLPIEMGYEPFKVRRLFNPPKQIRWDPKQPAGNLAFQVYGNGQAAPLQPESPPNSPGSQWLMTLQVSES